MMWKNCGQLFYSFYCLIRKIFVNKNAIKRKSLADINGGKLTEINRLLTEQTPKLTGKPKGSISVQFRTLPAPIQQGRVSML